jgi:hypothetical protein
MMSPFRATIQIVFAAQDMQEAGETYENLVTRAVDNTDERVFYERGSIEVMSEDEVVAGSQLEESIALEDTRTEKTKS